MKISAILVNWYPTFDGDFFKISEQKCSGGKQDSKELSPRSLDKMLLKRQVNSQNVQSNCLNSSNSINPLNYLNYFV